ncbi:MAG: cupin domain-containing protein, partial [Tidjanibacter sp.]|nr:cupin domain-containing protein [Tidjanibacter sp.]
QIETIEGGNTLPSLAPLIKIARALGVRLGTFLDDVESLGAVVCRAAERKGGYDFSNDNASQVDLMRYFPLSNAKENRHIEPFVIDIKPSETHEYVTQNHEGEEFIYVLEGEVEIDYGKHKYLLGTGDSIHYDCIVKHHVHAAGDKAAKILAVVYVPF